MHLAPTQRLALATVCLLAVNDPPALRVPKCLIRACAEAAPAASAAVPPPPPPPPSLSDVDVDALRSKLAADAKVGDYESAIAILERLTAAEKDKGRFPHPRLFDDTILACSRAEPPRWAEALETLKAMSACALAPGLYAFNNAIVACGKAGESGQASKLISQMKAAGVAPSVVSFNALLMGLSRDSKRARTGAWQTALQVLTQMRDRGLEPDLVSYGNAVLTCRRAVPPQGAQAVALIDDAISRGFESSESLLCEALNACAAQGDQEAAAKRMWDRVVDGAKLRGEAPSGRAFHARLYERGTANDWLGALELLEEMKAVGRQPDTSCVQHAARACGRAGAYEAVIGLLRRCESDYAIKPTERMYRSAIQACSKASKWEEALKLVDEAEASKAFKPSTAIYGAAMSALSKQGDWQQCLQLIERMNSQGVRGDVGLYGGALHALQAAKEWESVYELLYTMRAEGITTQDTLQPYHITLWKTAKKELGLAK